MKDLVLASCALAREVLSSALAELEHETKNGFDKERITRFTDLAATANRVLSLEVRARSAPVARARRAPPLRKCPCGVYFTGTHAKKCPHRKEMVRT